MGAYTSEQMLARLLALALGMAGGLCQTVWSQVVGMRCGSAQVGEYVFHTECLAWTELFLRFPQGVSGEMTSLTLAGAIAGFAAAGAGMWRPRWGALLFLALAGLNLGLGIAATLTEEQHGIAVTLGTLAVAAPAIGGVALWRWGEYRAPPRRAAAAG